MPGFDKIPIERRIRNGLRATDNSGAGAIRQGLGKVPDCLVHGLVMPSKGQHLGGVAGVVA